VQLRLDDRDKALSERNEKYDKLLEDVARAREAAAAARMSAEQANNDKEKSVREADQLRSKVASLTKRVEDLTKGPVEELNKNAETLEKTRKLSMDIGGTPEARKALCKSRKSRVGLLGPDTTEKACQNALENLGQATTNISFDDVPKELAEIEEQLKELDFELIGDSRNHE